MIKTLFALFVATIALSGCSGGGDATIPGPTLPVIVAQPADTSVVEGSPATFTVSASGAGPLTYQWQSSPDGTTFNNVAAATGASYTTPATLLAANGSRFRVVVSGALGGVTSSAARLTVTSAIVAPTLSVQPAAQSVTAPGTATFSVTATGTSPTFQWQVSTDGGATFTNIAGATGATYAVTPTTTAQSGNRYRAVVTNASGTVTSVPVILTVAPTPAAPVITTQPTSQTITAGANVNFTVAATGVPAPTLQWRLGGTDLASGAATGSCAGATVAGSQSTTLTLTNVPLACSGSAFTVVATNGVSPPATSASATLTVNPAPVAPAFTTQPAGAVTVTAGQTASFVAAATGVPTPSLQWQISTDGGGSFANITGATATTYTTPATVIANEGQRFRAIATNTQGTAASTAAQLFVYSAPVVSNPANVSATIGQTATFTVTVTGAQGAASLQWQRADALTPTTFVDVPGQTSATYALTFATPDIGALFRVRWSNRSNDPLASITNSGTTTGATLSVANALTATKAFITNRTTLVVRPDATVWGWGDEVSETGTWYSSGLTPGLAANRPVQLYPAQLSGVADVVAGNAGEYFALRTDGTVLHWGRANDYVDGRGLDGLGGLSGSRASNSINATPVQVLERRLVGGVQTAVPLDRVCSIHYAQNLFVTVRGIDPAGGSTGCAPADAKTVWAVGALSGGGLHSNTIIPTAGLPDSRVAGSNVASVQGSGGRTGNVTPAFVVLLQDGRTFFYGYNRAESFGSAAPSVIQSASPMSFSELTTWGTDVIQFAFGNERLFAVRSNTVVSAAGSNVMFALGDGSGSTGTSVAVSPPVDVRSYSCTTLPCSALLTNVNSIASSGFDDVTLAVVGGSVFGWGRADTGLTGVAGAFNTATRFPQRIGPNEFAQISAIAVGAYHAVAIGPGNVVYTWGQNVNGVLGRGPADNAVVPVPAVVTVP